MSIVVREQSGYFFLQTKKTSYVLQKDESGYLMHMYWGSSIKPTDFQYTRYRISNSTLVKPNLISQDTSYFEYPGVGKGDFRSPAIEWICANGDRVVDLKYKSHSIEKEKKKIPGLPSLYAPTGFSCDTLIITLEDKVANVEVDLYYHVFEEFDAITRYVCVRNVGTNDLQLTKILSSNVEFDEGEYEKITLSGMYAKEMTMTRSDLSLGLHSVESRRGISSHVHNPFLAIAEKGTTENSGQIYAMNFVYSGNFLGTIDVQNIGSVRMQMGLGTSGFSWMLKGGESFYAPEVVMVHSSNGLGDLSRKFHKLYKNCLNKGKFANSKRFSLLNSWEGTYMTFDSDKIFEMAKKGSEVGVKLFVLDDGWFGLRDDDTTSLGDWFEYKKKLPGGLSLLANKIKNIGLDFGLWFEPEMVSENSDLFRKHPDWCIQVPTRTRTEQRNQLVLDFTRKEVRDCVYGQISKVLREVPIKYVKWDMNRSFTEVFSSALPANQQGEVFHRYVLGLYEFIEKITNEFPDVFFENCCSGGGRFDPGMLHYFPLTWTSDTTDVIERLSIHYGTSLAYPSTCHSCHISPSPNGLTGRDVPFETRRNISLFSTGFGFQMDLKDLSEEEKELAVEAIVLYDKVEHIVRKGELFRIGNAPENDVSWVYALEDKSEAFACWVRVLSLPNAFSYRFKFKGLNPDFVYKLNDCETFNGDYLMNRGLQLKPKTFDFSSTIWHLIKV